MQRAVMIPHLLHRFWQIAAHAVAKTGLQINAIGASKYLDLLIPVQRMEKAFSPCMCVLKQDTGPRISNHTYHWQFCPLGLIS